MDRFKDVEFMSGKEKLKVNNAFKRFIKSLIENYDKSYEDNYGNVMPLPFKQFSKSLYEHLHVNCGFIAHYNRLGFYQEYFNGDVEDLKRFIEHFLGVDQFGFEVNNGYNCGYHLNGNYADINMSMAEYLADHKDRLISLFYEETRETDLLKAKILMNKHNVKALSL